MLISADWRPSEVRNTCLRLLRPETGPHAVFQAVNYKATLIIFVIKPLIVILKPVSKVFLFQAELELL